VIAANDTLNSDGSVCVLSKSMKALVNKTDQLDTRISLQRENQALKAENLRLKAEVERLKHIIHQLELLLRRHW